MNRPLLEKYLDALYRERAARAWRRAEEAVRLQGRPDRTMVVARFVGGPLDGEERTIEAPVSEYLTHRGRHYVHLYRMAGATDAVEYRYLRCEEQA